MMELLLEADRALANGALDQAERLYWQLLERDARNAIAVAGLAEISMRHGDLETARLFTLKALAIDPENDAARQLRAALERGGIPIHRDPALPLQAVQQLEAVGRRRMAEDEESEPAKATAPTDVEPPGIRELPEASGEPSKPRPEPPAAAPGPPAPADPPETPPEPRSTPPEPRSTPPEPRSTPTEPASDSADFMSADDFAAAEAAATVEAIDSLDDSVEFEIKPRHNRGRPHAIRMPRLPTLADLEPGGPHVQADTAGAAYPPRPAEPPRADPPQPPASPQPPVSRIAGALAQPGVPWLPPEPLPPAGSAENAEQTEEDAEAEAFREAMALLQNGGARPAPDRLNGESPVVRQPGGVAPVEPVEPVGSIEGEPVEAERVQAGESGTDESTEVPSVTPFQSTAVESAEVAAEPARAVDGEPTRRLEPGESAPAGPVGPPPAEPVESRPAGSGDAEQPDQAGAAPATGLSLEGGVDPTEIRKAANPDKPDRRPDAKGADAAQPERRSRPGMLRRILGRR